MHNVDKVLITQPPVQHLHLGPRPNFNPTLRHKVNLIIPHHYIRTLLD